MKFKAYGWLTIWRDAGGESSTFSIDLIPSVSLDYWRHDFAADAALDIKETHCRYFYVMFSWLIFGLTLDFRWGQGA